MQNSYYLNYDLHEPTVLGMFDQKLYGELGNFCEHFKNSDELVSVKENYEYYMLKKIVLQSKVKIEITPAQKEALEQEKINNTVLVGEQTEVPEQKGKVVKIFFPKLTPFANNSTSGWLEYTVTFVTSSTLSTYLFPQR